MRVRTHVHVGAEQELGRAHLVEEDEGTDHLCRCGEGSARRTSKPPRSCASGTMMVSMASQEKAAPRVRIPSGVPTHEAILVSSSWTWNGYRRRYDIAFSPVLRRPAASQ